MCLSKDTLPFSSTCFNNSFWGFVWGHKVKVFACVCVRVAGFPQWHPGIPCMPGMPLHSHLSQHTYTSSVDVRCSQKDFKIPSAIELLTLKRLTPNYKIRKQTVRIVTVTPREISMWEPRALRSSSGDGVHQVQGNTNKMCIYDSSSPEWVSSDSWLTRWHYYVILIVAVALKSVESDIM